ncbi:MAG: hypothetical protein QN198_12375 [Armatimonadota bacterium]|nr:hypothetical protein [Armatimonadota bacterium]MDR5704377.1 hypothetical protein [Armatimonadota bacterium]MDR7435290.1 hypothetical protein [Armatimonadota bacterium]
MRKHVIAAENFLLGATNFVVVTLPEGWKLLRGISPPEVDSNRLFGEVQWVTSGRSPHLLVQPERRSGAELHVLVNRGRRMLDKLKASPGARPFFLHSGHEAFLLHHQVRRGLWRGYLEKGVRLSLFCDRTDRTITLEITGRIGETEIQELLEALQGVECH